MLIKPDCIPCIIKMAVYSARELGMTEREQRELCLRMAEIPPLRGEDWDITGPDILERVMEVIISMTGKEDPFRPIKQEQNRGMTAVTPLLQSLVEDSPDHLDTAIKLAIIGNSIDLMMAGASIDIENSIKERLKTDISEKVYADFRERLMRSGSILFFGDNAGEIVIDKLLMNVIKDQYGPDITYVVRSRPALNDATINEALEMGLDKIAPVLGNGIKSPFPGTVLKRCSEEVNHLAETADLIISKGGGNFDTLSEEDDRVREKIFFMLLSKCHPYNQYFGVGLHEPVLANIGQRVNE